ncbi:MAG: sugar phosphate nucleotidyltransferase [Flavobacteriales bacterium]
MEIINCTINQGSSVLAVLKMIDQLPSLQTVFVFDAEKKIIGTITDGDIRRGFINGLSLEGLVQDFMNKDFSFLLDGDDNFNKLNDYRTRKLKAVPLISDKGNLIKVYDFTRTKSILPIDAVIMAGGKGERLRPLTDTVPKPLLKVGGKEIISYNFDRLLQFGITNQTVTVNYLGHKIDDFCKGYNSEINFNIIKEDKFLGTAGSLSLIEDFSNDVILLMNSDLLTDIDYEDFYKSFIKNEADILVASVPYPVSIPYAIFENEDLKVKSFKEKPEYIYYANAGIYLIKRKALNLIPKDEFYNATDLMEKIIELDMKLIHYPMHNYWLDIGKPADFKKANEDINNLKF